MVPGLTQLPHPQVQQYPAAAAPDAARDATSTVQPRVGQANDGANDVGKNGSLPGMEETPVLHSDVDTHKEQALSRHNSFGI